MGEEALGGEVRALAVPLSIVSSLMDDPAPPPGPLPAPESPSGLGSAEEGTDSSLRGSG